MSNSQNGPGFMIRLVILLLILAMVGGSFVVDLSVKGPKSAEQVQKVNELLQTETDDGHGISKDMIQKAIGFNPDSEHEVGKFKVEQYTFRRTIPFFTLRKLFVVYDGGGAVTLFEQAGMPSEQMIKRQLGPDVYDPGVPPPDKLPRAAGAGGPPPSSDGDKKSDGDKSEDESDQKSDDPAKKTDDKSTEDKTDGGESADKSPDKDGAAKGDGTENKNAPPAESKPSEKQPNDEGGGQPKEGDN